MALDLTAAGKKGVATGIIFDAFSPSRAYQFYHGGVRILSEAASVRIATPIDISKSQLTEARGFDPLVPLQNHPAPWRGGEWTLRMIVENNLISVWAVLRHAARFRDRWVRNFATIQHRNLQPGDVYAYLIPAPDSQRDPDVVADLVETLTLGSVEVHEAASELTAGGVTFPPGTLVVPMAQPFGRYARTLLEAQRYPELRQFPGGPLRPPYDNTAHSLPLQLGVQVVEVAEKFDVDSRPIATVRRSGGIRDTSSPSDGVIVSARTNASVAFVNAALSGGASVARLTETRSGEAERGSWIVRGLPVESLDSLARRHHVSVDPSAVGATDNGVAAVAAPRIGLYRSWRGQAIDSGWTELVLERYGFDTTILRNRDIRQGDLRSRFDVVVLPQEGARAIASGNDPSEYPAEFAGGLGDLGAYHLRQFVDDGGTLVALDSASSYAISSLYLPVRNALETATPLEFSSPGSLVRLVLDTVHPLAWGMEREVAAMFVSSPVFDVRQSSGNQAAIVAQHSVTDQLLAGWMQGAERIAGRPALIDVQVGQGRVILFGFRPQYRAQARGTYRLLFNSLYRATTSL